MLDHGLFYGLGRPGTFLSYAVVVDVVTVATTAVAVHWGLGAVAVAFVGVAMAATVARWVLVGRMLDLPIRAMARPFVTVLLATAVSMLAAGLVLDAVLPAGRLAALAASTAATVVVSLLMLRLLAGGILRDALSVLPVPERHAIRVTRWLRFPPVRTT